MKFVLVLSLSLLFQTAFAAEECGKAFIIEQGACDKLRIGFDLTKCGGDSLMAGRISECEKNSAQGYIKYKGRLYSVALTGNAWGNDLQWTPSGQVTVTEIKKKEKKKEEPKPVVAPEGTKAKPAVTPIAENPPTEKAPEPEKPVSISLTPSTIPVNWYGDFRYRFEKVGQDRQVPSNLIQNRIRARMGLKADLGDDTTVDFRLATGPGRATTNQTLGANNDDFANYAVTLDRAYFNWAFLPGLRTSAGRIPNPFWAPGGSDMIWDTDLNFDGMIISAENKGSVFTPFSTAGVFWLNKVTGTGASDTKLLTLQIGTKIKVGEDWNVNLGITEYHYGALVGRTNPFGTNAATSALSGNTMTGAANNIWVNGYELLDFGPEIQTRIKGKTLTLFLDYVRNYAVKTENRGYMFGFRFGDLKKQGDYQITYDYRNLQKDAAVDTFTDGDSASGGTDLQSHRACVSYKVKKNWQVGASYYFGDKFISSDANKVGRNKVHLDLTFGF